MKCLLKYFEGHSQSQFNILLFYRTLQYKIAEEEGFTLLSAILDVS